MTPRRRLSRSIWWAALAVTIVLGAALAWYVIDRRAETSAARPVAAPHVPVVAALAHKGDIGVYLTGLGTVTPILTISVKTRVDGQLMTVSYTEGQTVHQGDPLVEIDARPYQVQLEQAEGQLIKDQAALQNAQIDLKRYEDLITRNAVAQQVLATQRSTVAQDQGVVKTDQANIDNAKLNISYCHITASITGRVGLRLVDPGNMVSAAAATPLVVIAQIEPISVIFTIPEQQVPTVVAKVKAGRRLQVDAMDRDMGQVIASGTLTTLDNQIDQTTGTLRLRATFPNSDEALFPSQFVNSRLLVQQKTGVTLVPNAAIQRNTSTTFIYVVKPDQTVTIRTVKLGVVNAAESEVVSGVAPGETVVTQGVEKLQEGMHVTAQVGGKSEVVTASPPAAGAPAATSGSLGAPGGGGAAAGSTR